jgi:FkbM family methyltransferase
LDAHIIKEVFFDKDYDIGLINPKLIIDIGAHIGTFSIYYSLKSPNVKVYSYEPNKATFRRFKYNLRVNNLKNVIAIRSGVANKSGTRILYKTQASGLSSLYKSNIKGRSVKKEVIRVTTMSRVFSENKIKFCDLLKIDCEGSEKEILLSMSDILYNYVKNIVVEYHDNLEEHNCKELLTLLKSKNYKVRHRKNPFGNNVGLIYATK